MTGPRQQRLTVKAKAAQARLTEARLEIQATVAEAKLRHLKESSLIAPDWVGPWAELLQRQQADPSWFPIGLNPSGRRYGVNFPFYQNDQQHALIRDLGRIAVGTNNHAWGMLRGLRSFVVGVGHKFKVTARPGSNEAGKKAAARITAFLDHWAKQRQVRWYERQRELFWRTHRDGDGFLRVFPDNGLTKLRFAWPEAVVQPPSASFEEWGFGIEADPDDAETVTGYHFAHMGRPSELGDLADPDDVLHLKANADSGVKRGLSDFSFATREVLDAAARLTRNLAEGAAIREAIAFTREHEAAGEAEVSEFVTAAETYKEPRPFTDRLGSVTDLQPGTIVDYPKGLKAAGSPFNEGTSSHLLVVPLLLRSAGVRWNAPEWLVSGDASNMGAFTSSLVAESPFVRGVYEAQDYYKTRFLEVVDRTLGIAAAHELIDAEDLSLVTVDLEPPTPEVRNKLEAAQTAAIEVPLGVQSRQGYASEQGRDWDRIDADNQQYQDEHGSPGDQLPLPGDGPPRPESLLESTLLEAGFSGTITDTAGRRRTYADGKQVANPTTDPAPTDKPTSAVPADAPTLDADLKAIAAAHPDAAKSIGTWAKVKERAGKVREAVYGWAVRATPAAWELTKALADSPEDMQRFGFAPTMSGTGHNRGDWLQAQTGIGTHLAAGIAAKVLAAGYLYAKRKLTRSEGVDDETAHGLALELADLLGGIAGAFGLDHRPAARDLLPWVQEKLGAK